MSGTVEALQQCNKRHERDLGRIVLVREHRLAEEHAAERHAVESAHEPPVAPALHRVRVAQRGAARRTPPPWPA